MITQKPVKHFTPLGFSPCSPTFLKTFTPPPPPHLQLHPLSVPKLTTCGDGAWKMCGPLCCMGFPLVPGIPTTSVYISIYHKMPQPPFYPPSTSNTLGVGLLLCECVGVFANFSRKINCHRVSGKLG